MVLEAVAEVTSVPAETPHENWFHQRYGSAGNTILFGEIQYFLKIIYLFTVDKIITEGIEQLRGFSATTECSLHELWLPFKNMLQQLQHINYRRSILKLDDVSPALRQMKSMCFILSIQF